MRAVQIFAVYAQYVPVVEYTAAAFAVFSVKNSVYMRAVQAVRIAVAIARVKLSYPSVAL